MSNLTTDSKALMDFLFDGEEKTSRQEDTPIYQTIESLKAASLNCAELSAMIMYNDIEGCRKKITLINTVLAETWCALSEVQNDFKDSFSSVNQ